VDSVTPGHDDKGRHVDTVVHFTLDGLSTTVCFYNTTQRLKVEGKGYLNFSTYLHEYLRKKVQEIPEKIDNYNKAVIAALSGKRKTVSRPIRSVRYKTVVQIKCDTCNIVLQLNYHMKSSHTLSKQITNINEQSKISMTDDLSLMDLATEVDAASPLELEEQCQSQRLTTSPHLDATENHSESEVLVMDVNYPCTLCDAVFDSDENLKKTSG